MDLCLLITELSLPILLKTKQITANYDCEQVGHILGYVAQFFCHSSESNSCSPVFPTDACQAPRSGYIWHGNCKHRHSIYLFI